VARGKQSGFLSGRGIAIQTSIGKKKKNKKRGKMEIGGWSWVFGARKQKKKRGVPAQGTWCEKREGKKGEGLEPPASRRKGKTRGAFPGCGGGNFADLETPNEKGKKKAGEGGHDPCQGQVSKKERPGMTEDKRKRAPAPSGREKGPQSLPRRGKPKRSALRKRAPSCKVRNGGGDEDRPGWWVRKRTRWPLSSRKSGPALCSGGEGGEKKKGPAPPEPQ